MSRGLSRLEWVTSLYAEAFPECATRTSVKVDGDIIHGTPCVPSAALVDCKSLYDHLTTRSCPTAGLADPKSGLIILSIRETLERIASQVRWIPSGLMLADCLTKEMETD